MASLEARSTDSHSCISSLIFSFTHFFHSFNKYMLDKFYVPGTVLVAGDKVVNEIVLP